MTPAEDQFTRDLRLAREICLGLAAFLAVADGVVWIDQLPDSHRPQLDRRIEALARDSLSHPSARRGELFWNAGVGSLDDRPDDSLACVAIGLEHDGTWLGLLGVTDAWFPELDDEQRQSLTALARSLARSVAAGDAAAAGADAGGDSAVDAPRDMTPSAPDRFLGEVVEHLPDALVVAQDDGTIVYANQRFSALTGLAPDAIIGADAATLFGGDDPVSSSANWPENVRLLLGSPAPGRRLSLTSADHDHLVVHAWGEGFSSATVGDCYVGLIREAGPATGFGPEAVAQPIGAAVIDVLDALDEGILVCDAHGLVLMANRAARMLQGLDPGEDLVGQHFPVTTGLRWPEGGPLVALDHPLERALRGKAVEGDELLLGEVDHESRHVLASARPLAMEEGDHGALLALRDITPQVQSEAWLTHLAMHDPLTGLANRHLLVEHLRRMVAQTGPRGHAVSVVYLDLDGFKAINDDYGHGVGDEVLVTVAKRVRAVVRPSDVVARLGGDEFVVAHCAPAGSGSVEALVARIGQSLTAPLRVRQHLLAITASVGYVSSTEDDDPLALLVRADREMFRSKKAARSTAEGKPGR